ncbi:SLC13 family permease [Pseudooceanicola sp. CBS1P-1]|uniref:SLC13 family permease n=1 Tax=Pseudooceanicola albus TaxID=2692189 RepID=A0A6L7G9Z4_9RHOB|nr:MULTISPECIES: SLC13 family permease [Pseudooceanicola]MBT9386299.1 SLC13 family permease [Pseudooceanicola endophyticus]MXN20348.1 SLC13 family permease [Pseudooceanicola albus]
MSLVVVLAIVAAIVLGYLTRINIGLFAIAFAYIIGSFVMGMKPSEVIAMWPLKIFFVIFSVCLFYSFAMVNGTLEKLAGHLLYLCRGMPWLLPYAIFLTATIIAAMGAGYYTVLAFMAPITLILCKRTGMDLILGGMAVNYGALGGANFMSSQSGIIFRGLMTNAGLSDNAAFVNSISIFLATFLLPVAVITVLLFLGGRHRQIGGLGADFARPEPLDQRQKATLWLTLVMMAIVLAGPLAHLAMPANATITYINSKIDIGLIASVFSVIALMLKLGDERKAITSLPWPTLIMICGMGMLISVAIKAGTINELASWIGDTIPAPLVPLSFGVVAAIMSLFASTLGVVTPALFPMVPPLAAQFGLSPMLMFTAIVVGAQATSISPFSSGGSLILGSAPDDATRSGLFTRLLLRAAPIGFVAAMLVNVALTFLI